MGASVRREDLGPSDGPDALAVCRPGGRVGINPATCWVLQRHGIRAWGAEIPLDYARAPEALAAHVLENMNSSWLAWVARREAALRAPDGPGGDPADEARRLDVAVFWCVFGMLPRYYRLRERDVTSKAGAGADGRRHAPALWHPLIREAVALQRSEPVPVGAPRSARLRELVALPALDPRRGQAGRRNGPDRGMTARR
jgi:hypothetical protein